MIALFQLHNVVSPIKLIVPISALDQRGTIARHLYLFAVIQYFMIVLDGAMEAIFLTRAYQLLNVVILEIKIVLRFAMELTFWTRVQPLPMELSVVKQIFLTVHNFALVLLNWILTMYVATELILIVVVIVSATELRILPNLKLVVASLVI